MKATDVSGATEDLEIRRIKDEYARRADQVPWASRYGWHKDANQFQFIQAYRECLHILGREGFYPLNGMRVLDVGCGAGRWLLEFAQWGADASDLAGIDLAPDRIEESFRKLPTADLRVGDGGPLPWKDGSFDLVSQFGVFTSILSDSIKHDLAAEMLRVVKPGGLILWYDFRFNNPANKSVKGVERAEILNLFPNCEVNIRRINLAPPIARRLAPVSWISALLLEKFPLLCSHWCGSIRKPA